MDLNSLETFVVPGRPFNVSVQEPHILKKIVDIAAKKGLELEIAKGETVLGKEHYALLVKDGPIPTARKSKNSKGFGK